MRYLLIFVVISFLFAGVLLTKSTTGDLATPLEKRDFARLTTHAELVEYVERVSVESPYIEHDQLGASTEGRDILYAKISSGEFGADESKLKLLIFAQQHGNEPSGMEASLRLLRGVAEGAYDDLLEDLDILLVPQVNPDGGETNQRQNAEGVDLNRSHLILDAPETIALRSLFHEWEPHVTLDVHEYYPWASSWLEHGYVRLFDEQFGTPTNVNTNPEIRQLADETFLPFADAHLRMNGFTFHNYLIGSPDYIRYSTSNINDGRQSFALMNTFSLILEGKRSREEHGDLERRSSGQLTAIESLLKFSAQHKEDIRNVVTEGRDALAQGNTGPFSLIMDRDRSPTPLVIPVQRVEERNGDLIHGDTTIVSIDAYYPTVSSQKTTDIPEYYFIPGGEEQLIDLLELHNVQMESPEVGERFAAQRYRLGSFESRQLANATYRIPEVELESIEIEVESGDILVSTRQLHRLILATALEPQSKHGLLQYDRFQDWRDREYFPVLRIDQ